MAAHKGKRSLCQIVCDSTKETVVLPVPPQSNYSHFHNKVRTEFDQLPSTPQHVDYWYEDNEGDRCSINNTASLKDALVVCDGLQNTIHFDAKEPHNSGVSSWRGEKTEGGGGEEHNILLTAQELEEVIKKLNEYHLTLFQQRESAKKQLTVFYLQVLSYYRQSHKAAAIVIEKRAEYFKALSIFKEKCDEYLSFHEAAPVTKEWKMWLEEWFEQANNADKHLKEQSEEMEANHDKFLTNLEEFEKKHGNIGDLLSSSSPSLSDLTLTNEKVEKTGGDSGGELEGEEDKIWMSWSALGVDLSAYYAKALKFEQAKAESATNQEKRHWMRESARYFELLKSLHQKDKEEYYLRYEQLATYQTKISEFLRELDKTSKNSQKAYEEYMKHMLDDKGKEIEKE